MKTELQTIEEIEICGDYKNPSILILDNNPKILSALDRVSRSDLRVKVIARISEALNVISKEQVEVLIICTTNPGLEILTLCRAVNDNNISKSVGVIVITDSLSINTQIKLYDSGVDILLSSPVEYKLLQAVIKNLVRKRREKNNISNHGLFNNPLNNYKTSEYDWITRMTGVIESNINDSSFGYDQFAVAMNASKSTLYRKVKKLTAISPVEFLRNTRLTFASRLLLSTTDDIGYIAYQVGFNDTKHFANAFKSYFGVSPNNYRHNNKINRLLQ